MTLPLTFSLLFDKNRLSTEKRIAGLPHFHKQKERYLSLLILLKYFAVKVAIN